MDTWLISVNISQMYFVAVLLFIYLNCILTLISTYNLTEE